MIPSDLQPALENAVGAEHVTTAHSALTAHSRDQSSHPGVQPDVVVYPGSTQEVSAVVVLAGQRGIPIVPWGAGSSLEGNPIPIKGGIVIDFQRMNRLLKVYAADFQAVVQPGILYKDMNRLLARDGLFFAPDPGANATIGGMIANNAAGTRTPKYGATRDNVLALEVVLARGEIIRTGSRSIKQSAGYDLTRLFVGSEGTLGLVTEAVIRLAPLPAHYSAATVCFPSLQAAAQAVSEIIGAGLGPAALEILDAPTIAAINEHDGFELPEQPSLFLEFHGATDTSLEAELEMTQAISSDAGGEHFRSGIGRDVRNRLWAARHNLGELLPRLHPGRRYLIIDVSVPISAFPTLAQAATSALSELADVSGYLFGHAGDGNLHGMLFVPEEAGRYEDVQRAFNDRVVAEALRLGGTCTGEHGVGIGKQRYMIAEHGAAAVAVMRRIKHALDPLDLFNPGKILPPT